MCLHNCKSIALSIHSYCSYNCFIFFLDQLCIVNYMQHLVYVDIHAGLDALIIHDLSVYKIYCMQKSKKHRVG